jgi:prepilin-type N-terminal cleavage/methylation domain-containing protein
MRRRGFTLFEVLVTIGLIVVLVAAMSAFLRDALRIRARLSEERDRSVSAEAVMAELETALETCVVDDPSLGTGVSGDSTSIDVLRSGISTWRLGGADARRALEPVEHVHVEFRDGQQRVAIARGDSETTELPGQLFSVRFRYFDGTEWIDRFDSGKRGALPAAIEVSVWFLEPKTGREGGRPATVERAPASAAEPSATTGAEGDVESAALSDVEPAIPTAPPDRRRLIVIPDAAAAPSPGAMK